MDSSRLQYAPTEAESLAFVQRGRVFLRQPLGDEAA